MNAAARQRFSHRRRHVASADERVEERRVHVVITGEDLVSALPVEQHDRAFAPRELHHLPLPEDAAAVERLVHVPDHRVQIVQDVA